MRVQIWFDPPLQVQMSGWVPAVVLELGTSRHLPAPPAWISPEVTVPVLPPETRNMTVPCAGTEALIAPLVVEVAPVHRLVSV